MSFASFTTMTVDEVLKSVGGAPQGLATNEAKTRLETDGANEILTKQSGPWQLFLRQLRSPFIYVLVGAAGISLALGNVIEGLLILFFVVVNAVLSFSQEYHSAKALELLKQFVVKSARVRRNTLEQTLPSRELVVGDIILLEAGDIVPADARILEAPALMVDESILTGESIQVIKSSAPLTKETQQAFEASNILFSGTTIVSGGGSAVVIATGIHTAIGTISHLTTETAHLSSFEKSLNNFSSFIIKLVLATLVIMFIAHAIIDRGGNNLFELLVFAIALAVSVVPEALPVVTTISLSKGALKLARSKVVVKRLSAIEDLGSIEVLCTDKTGTITENRLQVAETHAPQGDQALWYATLASTNLGDVVKQANNSFDIALWQACESTACSRMRAVPQIAHIPFDPVRRRNSALIHEGTSSVLIVRGAPEAILDSCLSSQEEQTQMLKWTAEQGKQGRRVLAVATKAMGDAQAYSPAQEEHGLTLRGLISFEDPIKESTPQAIRDAQALGVMVKILTGDSSEVAGAVAEKIGLIASSEHVMTGAEFEALEEDSQLKAAETFHVFARVSPAQKHAIIGCLEKRFDVGFLGEGINDAPGLKIANVGIVVQGASDIAREAADVVLLQQSLEVIVRGISEGREVFANTLKYVKATLSSNFGNFYAVAIASFLIPTLPMLPIQILLVNLLSDFPMIAVATDRVDAAELRRPRSYQVKEIVVLATVLGLTSTIFDFAFFASFARLAPAILQTNWFMGSILTELAFMFSIRTSLVFWRAPRPSWPLASLTGLAAIATIGLPYTQLGQRLFSFVPPSTHHLMIILGLTAGFFVTSEIVKIVYLRYHRTPAQTVAIS